MTKETDLVLIKDEINKQLGDKETFSVLLKTTFKGLDGSAAKRAIMEGMIRGYTFRDFLEKNVYAIPFRDGYSLVTSIDYARKIGMRSGVVGKSAPTFEMDGDDILSCTVSINRKVGEYVGSYSATVYFKEYTTGKNLWASKPRTMIAKVAEMHALRMACPEELAQMYVEEERQAEVIPVNMVEIDEGLRSKVKNAKTEEELRAIWLANKGKGKEFARLVTDQRDFIRSVAAQEATEANPQ